MTDPQMSSKSIEVFFSYSHKDKEMRDELEKHLSILKHRGLISAWHDRKIDAGEEFNGEIDEHLNSARIILLLISSDFLASKYCYDIEMKRAMERHERGEAQVIPIILRHVLWEGSAFSELQALPTDAEPIKDGKWRSVDEAFADVAKGLETVINKIIASKNPILPPDSFKEKNSSAKSINDIVKDTPKNPILPPDSFKEKNSSAKSINDIVKNARKDPILAPDSIEEKNSSADSIYKKISDNINTLWVLSQKNLKNIILAYLIGLWLLFFYNLISPDDIVDTKLLDWLSVFVIMLFPWGLLVAAISNKKIKKGFILGLIYPATFLIFYFLFRYNQPDGIHCILWLFSAASLSTILYLQIRKDILHLEDEISLAHKP